MCATLSDRPTGSQKDGPTNFPTVPVKDVPAPELPGGKTADRPVILVVDHEPGIADEITEILRRSGYAAIPAYTGEDALETALLIPPDLVITDVGLPDISGLEVASVLRTKLPDCKVLLLSAQKAGVDPLGGEPGFAMVDKLLSPTELLAHVVDRVKPS